MAERETSLRPTPSDVAIVQSLDLGVRLRPSPIPDPVSLERPVMYINGDPHYVDGDDDVIYVEGPVEGEPAIGAHVHSTLPAPYSAECEELAS